MDRLISVGKGDPIPGREEILAGKQEGWDIFCEFCVEHLTRKLNRHHWFRKEGTAKQIALGITTKVFLAFKNNPETLVNMKTVEEIGWYLNRASWNLRMKFERKRSKLPTEPASSREAEQNGAESNNTKPEILAPASLNPERGAAARELVVLVERARRRLAPKHGETLDRATWGDSHKMIAQALGMKNEKAVGQALNRARQDLLKHMSEDSISALEMFVGGQIRKLRGEKQRSKQTGISRMSAH